MKLEWEWESGGIEIQGDEEGPDDQASISVL